MTSVDRPQDRPTGAGIPLRRSLRARVALSAMLATAVIIGITTLIEVRLFEQAVESEVTETGRLTAVAVADDLELREGTMKADDLARHLHEFIDATPELHSAAVVAAAPSGLTIIANTSPTTDVDTLETARQAIEARDLVWGARKLAFRTLAVPLARDGRQFGAVVVVVSFASLDRLRTKGRTVAAGTTAAAAVGLFLLIFVLGRVYILRPITEIQQTMADAGAGQMSARVAVHRADELGSIATGLNHMLGQIDDLHATLQQRVADATSELRDRNRDLVEMYQEMFRLREQMGRTEQLAAVGETASVVAHQIGTPLNLVSGHIQLLLEEHDASSAVARRLRIAQEQISKVTAAVRGLLDRTRHQVNREPMDLAALVQRLASLVQPAAEAAGVRLSVACPQAAPVDGDELQLEMALLNLVSNALDAMPGGGVLRLEVRSEGGRALLDVADTGSGIPAGILDRVFEPWVTTKDAGRGTGLGLSITRSVITEHGGSIRVRSTPGEGAVFSIELPLAGGHAEEDAQHG